MKKIGMWMLMGLLAAGSIVGCSASDSDSGANQGNTMGTSESTTQIHARIELNGQAGDVTAILFEVVCDDGTTASEYVPLEDVLSPDFVTGGNYPFADFFQVLPAGTTCTITATPMQNPDTPSEMCEPASTTIVVQPNVTTEVVLPIQCEGDGQNGAIDVVGVLNHPPIITSLSLDPSKFLLACVTGTVAVTATDPDGDALTYSFTVISTPPNAVYEFLANGNEFTFTAETPGTYIFEVVVTDIHGASTSLQFPIHVQTNPDCEHLDEICCAVDNADGTITFATMTAETCDKAGGQQVASESCKEEVCCKTADGAVIVNAADCPVGGVLPAEHCEQQACCRSGEGDVVTFSIIASKQCKQPAVIVPDANCKEVCCLNQATGTATTTTAGQCAASGGVVTAPDKCKDETCCRLEDGTLILTTSTLCATSVGATPVALDVCKQVVCCETAAGPTYVALADCDPTAVLPADQCGDITTTVDVNFTPNPADPCEPEPRIVVPSTGTHELAVFNTDTLLPLPGSPFATCSSPSRIIFDWNNDIISTCRSGAIQVQKHQIDGTILWTQSFVGCGGGSRGAVISPDGRLFVNCSSPATVYELDHATGAILNTVAIPTSTSYPSAHGYGLAADQTGVYVADYFGSHITKIDLATLAVAWQTAVGVYGFSTDGLGHIWAGGATALKKIDAGSGALLNQWNYPAGASFVHGVQFSPDGFVYGAAGGNVAIKFDSLSQTYEPSLATVAGDSSTKGVTAEFDNDVYVLNVGSATITKFPGGNQTGAVSFTTAGLNFMYGYSGDMTGLSLCQNGLVAEWLSTPINSGSPSTTWGVLSWSATTPAGTSVTMYYSIDAGPWLIATNGAPIGATGQVLALKAVLTAANPTLLPTLNSYTVTYTP